MTTPLKHDELQMLLPDLLEEGALDAATRDAAEAHLLECAECAAVVTDLRRIVAGAAELPAFAPSRDLWEGVEARIQAPVVPLDSRAARPRARAFLSPPWRRFALAASVLIAVTSGVTYTLVRRSAPSPLADGPAPAAPAGRPVPGAAAPAGVVTTNASRPGAVETFDREISSLRRIVDERRAELDTATVSVLEKNLRLIDAAIAESRAALAKDPASGFLADRLNRSYGSKLQLLREVATLPSRS